MDRNDNSATSDNVQEVFDYWRTRMGHTRARLDAKRRQKIRQRLLDGYTAQDLIDAIDGCAASPFHTGQNESGSVYDDLELIARDAKHVDQFIRIKTKTEGEAAQRAADERSRQHQVQQREEHYKRKLLGPRLVSG